MSRKGIEALFEKLFFDPDPLHFPLLFLLFPLSVLYGTAMFLRRILARREHFPLPLISVGNLIVGGSGKTPFVIALASRTPGTVVISRGYGRQSRGMVEVSRAGEILTGVEESGDEAMLMARALPECSVIVSEDRKEAIRMAIARGAVQIILDDGFNRVDIEKFEILLEPEKIRNRLPFPAGPFREFSFDSSFADLLLREGRAYRRKTRFVDLTPRMLLVTAIARPERLEAYLPDGVVSRYFLPDHAYFDEVELAALMRDCDADSLLVTEKDAVKMGGFKLPLSIIELEIVIEDSVLRKVEEYRDSVDFPID